MAVSTVTLLYPNTIADITGGDSVWSNPGNASAVDGLYATTTVPVSVGPAKTSDKLLSTKYLFNIPSVAIIDGIYVEVIGTGSQSGQSSYGMGATLYKAGVDQNSGKTAPATGLTTNGFTFGGSTDLWGASLNGSDVNNNGFGVAITGQNTASSTTATFSIDAVRMTLYWHLPPAKVPVRHMYKVYNRNWKFLGLLPNIKSEFTYALDINTFGTQIAVECGMSIDTAWMPTDNYTDESGNTYTDESGNYYYGSEGVLPIVSVGSSGYDTLIKNGNYVVITEVSYYNPNGIVVFRGEMDRWEAKIGGSSDDMIKITMYSSGQDLDNYIARGAPFNYTTDQSQVSQNSQDILFGNNTKGGYTSDGQTFTTGSGVTNIGQINLALNGAATVTVTVYTSPGSSTPIGTTTQSVSTSGAQVVSFAFAKIIPVTALTQYFFKVEVADTQSIVIYYQNTDVYSGGARYRRTISGGTDTGWTIQATNDLYFVTASGSGTTTATYTSKDPSTGMVVPIIQDYNVRGGAITTNSSSVDATGLSLTYTFSVQTILEAVKAGHSMSPNGFYYYVDVGTNVLYFKNSSNTADILIIKGLHIKDITLVATIEDVRNDFLFSGGLVSGSNLYKEYSDQASISNYGVRLDRQSDNRVTLSGTADAIGGTFIASKKNENYATTVEITAQTMDISTLKPGKIIGFRGFGTFVDTLLMQIVRVEYHAEYAILTLGIIPKKMIPAFEKITRGLVAQQTVANPTAPS